MHDWIDELCDELDIETELDESLVLDLAREAAHNVDRAAAPLTAYLLGYAAATHGADPEQLEKLAAGATRLAESWNSDEDDEDQIGEDVGPDGEDVDDLVDAE